MKKVPAVCYWCKTRLRKESFDVVYGVCAFFLCNKHFKELENFIEEHN